MGDSSQTKRCGQARNWDPLVKGIGGIVESSVRSGTAPVQAGEGVLVNNTVENSTPQDSEMVSTDTMEDSAMVFNRADDSTTGNTRMDESNADHSTVDRRQVGSNLRDNRTESNRTEGNAMADNGVPSGGGVVLENCGMQPKVAGRQISPCEKENVPPSCCPVAPPATS